MKKIIFICLSVLCCLGAWANGTKVGNIYYIFDEETLTCTVTYTGSSYSDATDYALNVTIPSTVTYDGNTYTVTGIGDHAFYNGHWDITSISLPETITSIGTYAFAYCWGLTSLTIPNKVASIPTYAFYCCEYLQTMTLSSSLTEIGNGAFQSVGENSATGSFELTSLCPTVPTATSSTYDNYTKRTTLNVPQQSLSDYSSATFWSGFKTKNGVEIFTIEPAGCVVDGTNVTLCSTITSYDGQTISEKGFEYWTGDYVETQATKVEMDGETTATVYGLQPNTEYHFHAYAKVDSDPTYYSVISSFTTGDYVPVMVVDPSDGDVKTELSEIVVSCEDGMEWNTEADSYFQVKNSDGNVVAGVWDAHLKEEGDNDIILSYSLTLYDDAITTDNVPITLTDPGDYTFTIPEGFFFLGSDKTTLSEAVTVNFSIEAISGPTGNYSYTVDPPQGEVESLKTITFTSDEDVVDGFCGNEQYSAYTQKALVYDRFNRGDPITTATMEGQGAIDDYDTSILLTLDEEITEPGSYSVVIPEGSFYWVVDDEPILNEEITLTYGVTGPLGEYTFDPEDGKTLTSLSEIVVYYSTGIDCSLSYIGEISVTNEAGVEVAYDLDCETTYPEDDPYGDGLYCTIKLSETITATGEYSVYIPEGYFIVGTGYLYSDPISLTYYIEGGEPTGTYDYTVDPAEGDVESLKTITFTSDEVDGFLGNYSYAEYTKVASVYKAGSDAVVTTATMSELYTYPENYDYGILLTLADEVTDLGSYTVVIPEGSFYWVVDEEPVLNEELTLSYKVTGVPTGISGINIGGENVSGIYSTSGQKLSTTVKGVNIVRMTDGSVKKIYVK